MTEQKEVKEDKKVDQISRSGIVVKKNSSNKKEKDIKRLDLKDKNEVMKGTTKQGKGMREVEKDIIEAEIEVEIEAEIEAEIDMIEVKDMKEVVDMIVEVKIEKDKVIMKEDK